MMVSSKALGFLLQLAVSLLALRGACGQAGDPCSLVPNAAGALQHARVEVPDCGQLAAFAQYLCTAPSLLSLDMVATSSQLQVHSWVSAGCTAKNVTVVCTGAAISSNTTNPMRCAGAFVNSSAAVAKMLDKLQDTHDNITLNIAAHSTLDMGDQPRVYTVSRNVIIQSNETGQYAWLDVAAGAAQFVVESGGPFLELSWIALKNLAMGPPQAFMNSGFVGYLWQFAFDRVPGQVAMRMSNVDLAVPADLYKFLSVWFTRLLSPIAAVHNTALWIAALPNATLTKFQLAVKPGNEDVIYNVYRQPPGHEWVNVTIAAAPTLNVTLMPNVSHSGMLDITFDAENYASGTQVVTVCSPASVLDAVARMSVDKPYVLSVCNTSFAGYHPSPAVYPMPANSYNASIAMPSVVPPNAAVLLQTHPLLHTSLDLGGQSCAFSLSSGSVLRLRNFTLYNGGVQQPGTGPPGAVQNFTAGLWAVCNISADTSLFLERITLVVPHEEFAVLRSAALGVSCGCALSRTEKASLDQWRQASAFSAITDNTIKVDTWAGWRWRGSAITVTADPHSGAFTSLPLAAGVMFGQPGTPDDASDSDSGFPVAAVAVPIAVGVPLLAALAFFLVHSHKRKRQQQAAAGADGMKGGNGSTHNKDIAAVDGSRHPPGSAKSMASQTAGPLFGSMGPHMHTTVTVCHPDTVKVDMPAGPSPPGSGVGSGSMLVGMPLPPQPASPTSAAAAAGAAVGGVPAGADIQLPPTPRLAYPPQAAILSGQLEAGSMDSSMAEASSSSSRAVHAGPMASSGDASMGAGPAGSSSVHGMMTRLGGVSGPGVAAAGEGSMRGLRNHHGGSGHSRGGFGGSGMHLPPGLMHHHHHHGSGSSSISPESSVVYASMSSGSRSSFGSLSDGSEISASGLMMSDSFDRPGSEYGDYNLIANQDMDNILNGIRAELSDTSKLIIYGVLGAGAHGVVYKGEWRGRPVAVKTLLFQEHVLGGRGKQQALQEVAVNSRFAVHPNIVNTYTYELKPITQQSAPSNSHGREGLTINELHGGAGDYKLYIVQEFCDAGHLKKWIDSGRLMDGGAPTPSMLSVVQVALDLACGLQHVHFKNVIHGDLSPANVLLKSDPNRPGPLKAVAKVGDFGLSRFVHREQSHVSNVRAGTPFYTAPEVMLHGQLTRAADVFSLGVILYELYCGQPPWRRKIRPPTSHKAHKKGRNKLPASLPPSLHGPAMSCPQLLVDHKPPAATPGDTPPASSSNNAVPQTLEAGEGTPSGTMLAGACLQGGAGQDSSGTGYASAFQQQQPQQQQQQQQDDELGLGTLVPDNDTTVCGSTLSSGEGVLRHPVRSAVSTLSQGSDPGEQLDSTQSQLAALHRYMASPEGTYPLQLPASCPDWYRQLIINCLQADPTSRPKLPGVVTLLMKQQAALLEQYQAQHEAQGAGETAAAAGPTGLTPLEPLPTRSVDSSSSSKP